jgi:hypothetical protein
MRSPPRYPNWPKSSLRSNPPEKDQVALRVAGNAQGCASASRTPVLPPMSQSRRFELGFLCSTYELARLYSCVRISGMKPAISDCLAINRPTSCSRLSGWSVTTAAQLTLWRQGELPSPAGRSTAGNQLRLREIPTRWVGEDWRRHSCHAAENAAFRGHSSRTCPLAAAVEPTVETAREHAKRCGREYWNAPPNQLATAR